MPKLEVERSARMRRSLLGRIVVRLYRLLPARQYLLRVVTRLEGGELTSLSLRAILRREFDVEVGPYAYGSLLTPGMADRFTTIEGYASIGPGVRRLGANHPMAHLMLHPYFYNPALGLVTNQSDVTRTPCVIGFDSWIGANVLILPGCKRIGRGAVIGAGSVVTRDVRDYAIVAGNPARPIAERLTPNQREFMDMLNVSELQPEDILRILENQKTAP